MRLGRGWFTRKEAAPEFVQGVSKPLSLIVAMTVMHYYAFNIGDYTSHTAHLTPLEDIAYRRLLDLYYQTETPISNDLKSVCRHIRMREHEQDVQQVLSEFFTLTDSGWSSSRCDREISDYKSKAEKARANGKLGGRPKKLKESENNQPGFSSFDLANPDLTKTKANQEPITNNQETIDTADKSARSRGTVLKTYIEECKANGVKPIPDDHHSREFARDAGIEPDMLAMCWFRFLEDHTTGARSAKRYKDWGQAFGNAVKANWYKFWFMSDDGVQWTSQGRMYKTAYDAKHGD